MRGRSGIGYLYVIYIGIFLYGLAHKLFRTVLTFLFRTLRTSIEITALTIDGTLEYQRFSGMSLLKLLDEREKPFFNLFNRRVGKGIKNKGIRIRCAKHIAKIGLELAVTGTTQVKDVQSCGTAQLRRVVHCGSGGAAAVRETAAEESNSVAERIFKGQKCLSFLHANLQFAQLALNGQINQAFLLLSIHIVYQRNRIVQTLVARNSTGCIDPLAVLTDVKVVTASRNTHSIGWETHITILRVHGNDGGVGAKGTNHSHSATDLPVLACRKTLETSCIHTMVRIGVFWEKLPQHCKVCGIGPCKLHIFSRLGNESHRTQKQQQYK